MSLASHPSISWCRCAGQAVFLDLEGDRYFCLPEPLDAIFQRWAAGEAIDRDAHTALVAAGVAGADPTQRPQPVSFSVARRDLAHAGPGRAVWTSAKAIFGQLRAKYWLRRRPLANILRDLPSPAASAARSPGEASLQAIAGAFATSAMVLPAADQCLPRAIAAARLCWHRGLDAALILGVRLHPFAAHSWVQSGDAVVVGDLEQVRLYTPILVLQ
ncbi:lasso peptide biosynthesis B2 protein [uncultured Sphingomonas sp.]|uniref:lasso peptide biosynthesis B2 protein n=1 Tax=uncultured Sphingomonas sp. TaxID=158754 RepID=UPI0025FC0448|nr:lasso peptide biosynthesis B2 protein [uncultured Sphingomonas sp.]